MARFYASIKGQAKTEATRIGNVKSGISGHVRGWDVGVRVEGRVDNNDNDVFLVYATGGSNRRGNEIFLGTVTLEDSKITFKEM